MRVSEIQKQIREFHNSHLSPEFLFFDPSVTYLPTVHRNVCVWASEDVGISDYSS